MHHELRVLADANAVASAAARFVTVCAKSAAAARGTFTFAVSGGRTPRTMFTELAHSDMPWSSVRMFQVDERVAPSGHPERNLTHMRARLGGATLRICPMLVEDADLDAGASAYAAQLPARFDLVHLGLGPDGHTASLVPGDAVLTVTDRLVAPTAGDYEGRRRMTLTYPALARADQLLWLVTGADKRNALERLLDGDPTIPAARVVARASLIIADEAAAGAPPDRN